MPDFEHNSAWTITGNGTYTTEKPVASTGEYLLRISGTWGSASIDVQQDGVSVDAGVSAVTADDNFRVWLHKGEQVDFVVTGSTSPSLTVTLSRVSYPTG